MATAANTALSSSVYNSGSLGAVGGTGTDGGGSGNNVIFSTQFGSITNSGVIASNGADGGNGNGGSSGNVSFLARGGAITNTGAVNTRGGNATQSNFAGGAAGDAGEGKE